MYKAKNKTIRNVKDCFRYRTTYYYTGIREPCDNVFKITLPCISLCRLSFEFCGVVACSCVGTYILRVKHNSYAAFETSFDVIDIIIKYVYRDRYYITPQKKRKRVTSRSGKRARQFSTFRFAVRLRRATARGHECRSCNTSDNIII